MTFEQISTIIPNLLPSAGLAIFIWYLFRGLKIKINALNTTIEAQKQTLEAMGKTVEAMEKQNVVTEKIGDSYKILTKDYPELAEMSKSYLKNRYETVISGKDEEIAELKKAIETNNKPRQKSARKRLEELEDEKRRINFILQEAFGGAKLPIETEVVESAPVTEIFDEYGVSYSNNPSKVKKLLYQTKPE